ncbi:hypothetical protein WQ57_25490 [Mesobacillus campisalis]|uniref:Uncharacterized protein n=1 Tax=Mesobacillus campisalis TaxID=1408103 RepID=A0A0M2SEV7_9BACI|nr:hypothetical protein WQ57_25490 [Mesobacillus campisalis]
MFLQFYNVWKKSITTDNKVKRTFHPLKDERFIFNSDYALNGHSLSRYGEKFFVFSEKLSRDNDNPGYFR